MKANRLVLPCLTALLLARYSRGWGRDVQTKTEHPWYPGNSPAQRLSASSKLSEVLQRVTGRPVETDEDKAMRLGLANLHYITARMGW